MAAILFSEAEAAIPGARGEPQAQSGLSAPILLSLILSGGLGQTASETGPMVQESVSCPV